MMAEVYTRHTKGCGKKNRHDHRCGCPLWIFNPLAPREEQRWSANTNEYDEAQRKAAELGADAVKSSNLSVMQAVDLFLLRRSKRNNDAEKAPYKDKYMLRYGSKNQTSLVDWAKSQNFTKLRSITTAALDGWRNTWVFRENSYSLKIHNAVLKAFFTWAVKFEHLAKNPFDKLDSVTVETVPTLPLSKADYQKMLDNVDACKEADRYKMICIMQLMRWSGLGLIDACCLHRAKLGTDDKLQTYRQKTDKKQGAVYVQIKLPAFVADMLRNCANIHPEYFFRSPTKRNKNSEVHWVEDRLRLIYDKAGISPRGAHRFRDTFAVEYLDTGGDMEKLARFLGHSNSNTTRTHYNPWDKNRQAVLDADILRSHIAQGIIVPAVENALLQ